MWPGTVQPSRPTGTVPAVFALAPVGRACGRRARTAVPPRHLPAWPPPHRLDAPRDATRRPAPLSLSPVLISSSARSLSHTAECHHRRRSLLPQPPPPPRPLSAPESSATTSSTSSTSQATGDAPYRRLRRHLQLWPPWISTARPSPAEPPPSRRCLCWTPRELPPRIPLSPLSFASCSHDPARGQTPAAAASSAPASSAAPAASRWLPWMRGSAGNPLVPPAAAPVASSGDSAVASGRRRRAPSPESCHVGPACQVISLVLITT